MKGVLGYTEDQVPTHVSLVNTSFHIMEDYCPVLTEVSLLRNKQWPLDGSTRLSHTSCDIALIKAKGTVK